MDRSSEQLYEAHARSVPVTTPAREKELSILINGEPGEIRDEAILELVSGNMRLVLDLTRKYRRMPDYPDTLFDGNLGLVKAAATFDATKGRFSTWATPAIKTEIRDGILRRVSSSLSVSRYAAEMVFKGLAEDGVKDKDMAVIKLAMMDAIPLYDHEGKPLEIIDHEAVDIPEAVSKKELLALVSRATTELGLTNEEVSLVSEAGGRSGDVTAVCEMAKTRKVAQSNIRMLRAKLVWQIRRKILEYVGNDEYLILSVIGRLPGSDWR